MKIQPAARSLIASFVLIFFLVACSTVPETGRRQLTLISPDQEMQMGLTSFQQMKDQVPISKNAKANETVERVGKKIASVANLPNAQWEFIVFESKEANAFCLPGGKVGVYTGLLEIIKNDDELATVIGHEVAHAVARHGGERVSHAMVLQTGGELAAAGLSRTEMSAQTQQIIAQAYGLTTTVGVQLPHSRKQELEADKIGILYMARAGYNPLSSIDFWERFAEYSKQRGDNTPWFFRTHPPDETRIQQLKEMLPQAQREYQKAR